MNSCQLDHIVVTAPTLEAGSRLVKQTLGVTPQKGGEHPKMGTHNLLLSLGEATYLEVIACNPGAERPSRPRWFGLDDLEKNTPVSIRTWVVRTDDIRSTHDACPESTGTIEAMSREENRWLITIAENGSLPMKGGAPALIEWQSQVHPASKLIDHGLSLAGLKIYNPETERIAALLDCIELATDIELVTSKQAKIVARINTPNGIRELS